MSNKNNPIAWAVVILVGLMFLLAFRSILFVLPFGLFSGPAHVFRDTGHHFWGLGLSGFPLFLFPLALLALWIFVLLWVYRDAESRGMNGLLWALLVLFGNVIALLIFLILRNESSVKKPAPPAEKCPACGDSVGSGFTFCPQCGAKLKQVCPGCGKPVDGNWKVCPSCGAGLGSGKSEGA